MDKEWPATDSHLFRSGKTPLIRTVAAMTLFRSAKRSLDYLRKKISPSGYAKKKLSAMAKIIHEPELNLLPCLCDPRKMSIDIGASDGIFTAHLLKHSRRCVSFEPRIKQAEELRFILTHAAAPGAVEPVALSDISGTTTLRMLVDDPGRSTIENENSLEDEDGSSKVEATVVTKKLDDYAFEDVGFIKIDVEGHEVSVIAGSRDTITRNRPVMLIEVEDRHRRNAVNDVYRMLEAMNYRAFFLNEGQLCDFSRFDRDTHQNQKHIGGWRSGWQRYGTYINNFIFLPAEREPGLTPRIESIACRQLN